MRARLPICLSNGCRFCVGLAVPWRAYPRRGHEAVSVRIDSCRIPVTSIHLDGKSHFLEERCGPGWEVVDFAIKSLRPPLFKFGKVERSIYAVQVA